MGATENGLSYNQLDYRALIEVAKIAHRLLVDRAENRLRMLAVSPERADSTPCYITNMNYFAQWLCEDASKLRIVTNTLSALMRGLDGGGRWPPLTT